MPQPTASQVHEDKLLTSFSIAYKQDQAAYIADKVFPFVGVEKQSDKYRKYTKNDWFRDEAQKLAPGSEAPVTGYNLSTDTYYCDVWALAHDVDEQVAANHDQPGDPETDATELLTQQMLIKREREWHSAYFASSIWGTTTTPAALWSDYGSSDPKANVDTAVRTILVNTGFKANTMVVGYDVHLALIKHPLIRDQFKYTSSESIDAAMLARYFGIQRYMVSEAIYATNQEGQSEAYDFVAGKHALVCYSAPRATLKMPSAGYTIGWSGLTGLNNLGMRMLRIPAPLRHANRIEINAAYDMKLVASDLGYFFASVVA